MKTLRLLATFIVLVGACLTVRGLYLHAKAELASLLIRRAWGQSMGTGKPHAPWAWADTHPIGRLRIPRLGYDEIVLEDASPRNLAFGPARLMSGAAMGEAGNLILAGHRTSWFRPLQEIAPGDRIEVDWFDVHGELHERIYTVEITRVTKPEDVSLLTPTPEDSLTLITCYPFGSSLKSPLRFVVRASPLEAEGDQNNTIVPNTSTARTPCGRNVFMPSTDPIR